jgi:hypothetical protein
VPVLRPRPFEVASPSRDSTSLTRNLQGFHFSSQLFLIGPSKLRRDDIVVGSALRQVNDMFRCSFHDVLVLFRITMPIVNVGDAAVAMIGDPVQRVAGKSKLGHAR